MTQKKETNVYKYIIENMISALTDMKKILEITEIETLEKTIEHMTNTIPNMRYIPSSSNLETMQKTIKSMTNNFPVLTESTAARDEEVLQTAIKEMVDTTMNMINILDIANKDLLQKTLEFATPAIPRIIRVFSLIDWGKFEPSDEDIQIAQRILRSKGIEQFINEGFSEEKVNQELSNPFKTVLLVLMLLYSMIGFINDLTIMTVREITHSEINPTLDAILSVEQTREKTVENQTIRQVNDLLKEKIPTEIIHLFMIVEKSKLNVHQMKSADSKRVGTLDVLDIVQVFEREKDWARVLCEHQKTKYVIEGWVLSKHLKEIK